MNDATNPANRPDAANYMKLFPEDRTRCAPGALMSNDSRLAYLVHLKELIQAFEVRADVNAPITLLTRRPDLLTLKLDDRNARRTLPKIRITLELLENRAQQALAKNQTLQAAVAQGSGQASVPFHRAWESVKATLAAKQVQLWDLLSATSLCYPLFTFDHLPSATQRTATTLASGFSPQLRTLLLDATPSELMLSATAYDTTRKLAKALALSRRELRQLLAVEAVGKGGTAVTRSPHVPTAAKPSSQVYGAVFINNGATPLYLLESAPAQPATKKIVRIEGLTDAHLDRLQRILRLQRALGLSAAQTDTLVMAALRAEGQTGNYQLTDKTLRALGLFRHLQQKYNVSAEQYAALIDALSPYATGRQASFYDQLFAAGHDEDGQPAQPSLKLDDKAFDPASTTGADGLTVKQLALGLKVDDTLLRGILDRVVKAQNLQKPTRSLAVVSACYRIVALARVFGTSTLQGLSLIDVLMNQDPVYCQQLAGQPSLAGEPGKADIIDVIAGVLQAAEWLQHQGMDALQLAYLLNPRAPGFHPAWGNAFNPQGSQNADALHLQLKTALGLESPNLVAPLLRWAGVDAELLSTRIAAIAAQCTAESTTPKACFTESDLTQWSTLQRYADVTKLFKLSAHLLDQLTLTPERFNLKDPKSDKCRPLDLSTLYQLGRYKAVMARLALGMGEQDLLVHLQRFEAHDEASSADNTAKEHWAALEQLLGRTSGSLCGLIDIAPPDTLTGIDRLLRTLELADKHQLALDTLLQLSRLPSTDSYAPFQQAAVALRKGCSAKQRKVVDEQHSVAWRDALMQWMIAKWAPTDPAHSWITSTQTLADYLLIDLQVSHEPLTTRTLSATASLQRYLHQIHSRLENGYRSTAISDAERDEWENFSSSYERWRLRQDAHNEPQNFIDPTRRQRKTSAFKDLETQLAQGKCQPEDIHMAMLGYLSTFETLSNIQPISVYADGTSPLTDTYHFIGKTNVEPTEFYWRTLDMSQRDQQGVPSMLAWGEWEKISLAVSATIALTPLPPKTDDNRTHIELIRPVIVAGRRYVVWVERDTTGIPMGPDSKPSEYFALRVLFAFQQTDGNWSPPNEFMTLDGHDEQGVFKSSEVLATNTAGTAANTNVYLKTRTFMPGLMVMVNIHGDRLHDPWLTTVVFDSSLPAEEGKEPKRNVDYFISTKDLLLLEDKALDHGNETDRPIETNMVKRWLSFFRDPRTVQHPYVGAVTRLKEVAEDSKAFNWSDLASTDQVKDRYEITTLGQALIKETLSYVSNRISVDVTLDSLWTLKKDCISITFDEYRGSFWKRTVSINIYSLPFASHHKEKILSSSNLIALANSPFLDEQEQEHISSLLNKLDKLAEKIKNMEAQADKKHDEEIVKLQNEKEKNTKDLIQHLDENYKVFTFTSKITDTTSDRNLPRDNSITLNVSFTDSDGYETRTQLNSNASPLLAPKQISLSIFDTRVCIHTYLTSIDGTATESYLTELPEPETKPNPKPDFSELTIKLTSKPKENSNPSWTLSAFEQACLDEQHLQAFKTLPTDNADAFKTLKNFLLKVRYLPADQYSELMGVTNIEQPLQPIALHTAIDTAKALDKADAINTLIAQELNALKNITPDLPDESLQAILRLRYLHPATCRRILFYLDPAHEMAFEDTLIANGKGAVNFSLPINKDIRDYTVSLDFYDEQVSTTDPIATATCAYTLEEKDDDAIPSVQICRNEAQALYLDFKEVNNKAEDQTSAPPFRTLRLNTLFGKQLVALATQSVEQSLSWKAQHLPEPPLEPASSGTIVDLRSANGLYFWELFFHVPFLVTWLQRQNREYSQAWRWCTRFLFDPYRTWVPEGNHPPLFWLTRPLLARAAFTASAQTNDPDLLAYAEPERYRKALHLFVVENWQRQGDDQYRMLTLDSLVEAALCYDKALRLIGVLPEDLSSAPAQPPTLAEASSTAFTPPLNNKLVTLRNLLRDRLFNLRHGLTLDGKPAAIMLDPDTLDQIALGNSVAAQDRGEATPVAPIVPPCRYEEARKCAGEAVQQLIALGQTLLGFYNTEAAQQLELLGKRNLIRLLDFPCQLQEQALELAKRERETAVRSRAMVQQRQDYYQHLVDEGVIELETAVLALAASSVATRLPSVPSYAMAAGAAMAPTIFGMAVGGFSPQEAFESAANAWEAVAETLETMSNTIDKQAEYILRRQQWQHEADQATHELGIIDAQLRERDIQIKAAGIAVHEARATRQAHQAEYEVMQSVFASHTTYLWLIGRLSEIYSTAYDATTSLCLMAENCLQYELGDFTSRWIRTDGWLDNWRGMLAGEALERDLMQMDVAAIRDNHRPLDIRKDFSLLELTGWTASQLHEQLDKDEILFELPARLFDIDFPGHYLRRLERITLAFEIPGSGSSKPISAMLYQTSNKVLLEADIEGARHLYSASQGSPKHVLRDLRPNQSIALWSVKEVSRNFDLQPSVPDKARYQPFEGTGLISSWRLAFPGGARNNPVFYKDNECRLKDITITVSYSAVDGPTAFRDEVKQLLQAESTTGSADGGDSAAGESPSGNGSSQPASSGNADNAIVTAREAEQAANAALATAQAQADNPALKAPEAAKQLKQVTEAIAKAEKAAEAASTARKNTEAAAKKGQVDSAQASADEAQKNAKSAREAAESAQNACKDAQDAAKAREAAAREAAEKAAQEAADKLKAEIATAVASAKAAAEAAEASQKSAQADYQATSMNIPEASAEKKEATGAMGKLQAAVDEAKKAYQDAEAAASEGELATAQAKARSAQEAAKRADSHAKTIAAIRKKTDTFQTLAQLQAAAKDLVGKQVQYAYKTGETYTAKVVSWAEDHVKFEGWGGGPATKMMFSSIAYLKAN